MGDQPTDRAKTDPSLELPSLSLPRLRHRKRVQQDEPAPSAQAKRLQHVPAVAAAALTGLVVGLVGTALTSVSLWGCDAARGTSSCGGGPGFLILIAIVALMIVLGTVLLEALGVSGAGSTSILAVGVICVVVLVALLGVVFSVWMFLVMPALGAAAYSTSQWVTGRFES